MRRHPLLFYEYQIIFHKKDRKQVKNSQNSTKMNNLSIKMVLLLTFSPHFTLKMVAQCQQMVLLGRKINPELTLFRAKNLTEPTSSNPKIIGENLPER
jgi:hypothetical protein